MEMPNWMQREMLISIIASQFCEKRKQISLLQIIRVIYEWSWHGESINLLQKEMKKKALWNCHWANGSYMDHFSFAHQIWSKEKS